MGDIADMMLDGILDANGEYTGRNPGYPVYPKGWFNNGEASKRNSKVKCFMKERGINTSQWQKQTLIEYGRFVGTDRPTFHANENWKTFKAFIDAKVKYIKPSRLAHPTPIM